MKGAPSPTSTERVISDRQRELEQTKAGNAALIAQVEAKRQEAMGVQRVAELDATQIAQARADTARVTITAQASAEAEAIRIRTVASASAEAIEIVNKAIAAGGESYFRYRRIEMLPIVAPQIAQALAEARLVTVSGTEDGGAANGTANQIVRVIQTVMAAQLVSKGGLFGDVGEKKKGEGTKYGCAIGGTQSASTTSPSVLPAGPESALLLSEAGFGQFRADLPRERPSRFQS